MRIIILLPITQPAYITATYKSQITLVVTLTYTPHTTLTAASEVEEGMSLTNQLEELRKEGGDKWLAILNADKRKVQN